MDSLQHDLLIEIAERIHPVDLESLRLVSSRLNSAVRDVGVPLQPEKGLEPYQLRAICTAFRRATSLNLSGCSKLTDASLAIFMGLSNTLISLNLLDCNWLSASGLSHIPSLTKLEVLTLSSGSLRAIPATISNLQNLKELSIGPCLYIQSLPETFTQLTSLQTLCLLECFTLALVPSGISAMTDLRTLDLSGCNSLEALPEGITNLARLETFLLKV